MGIPVVLLGTLTEGFGSALRSIHGTAAVFGWELGIGLRRWISAAAATFPRLFSLRAVRP